MHADCRRTFIDHKTFRFDRVFDEHASSEEVYVESVRPLGEVGQREACSQEAIYRSTS